MKDEQRVALTKRLLREGLLRILQSKDIDKVNIKELCVESGINRATFYRHYEIPKDILREIRYEIFEEVRLMAENDQADQNPLKWLQDICNYFYSNADTLNILFQTRTDDDFIELLNVIYSDYFVAFAEASSKKGMDDASMKLAACFFASGIYCVIRQWLMEPIPKSPEEIAELLYKFISPDSRES